MKKILSLLGAITIVGSAPAVVVSCDNNPSESTAYDLSNLKEIKDNVGVTAKDPASATKDEVTKALDYSLTTVINKQSGKTVVVNTDYTYVIYSDKDQKTEFVGPADLSTPVLVYVVITAKSDSSNLTGVTGFISIKLVKAEKYDLTKFTEIKDKVEVTAKDATKTTSDEVTKVLSPVITDNINKQSGKTVTEKTDYTYEMFSDTEGKTKLDTVDLTTAAATIYIKITAVEGSINLSGATKTVVSVNLVLAKYDLTKYTISQPIKVTVDKAKKAVETDVTAALTAQINSDIKTATGTTVAVTTDYTIVIKDAKGQDITYPFDLTTDTQVKVTITASGNSKFLVNASPELSVTLTALPSTK